LTTPIYFKKKKREKRTFQRGENLYPGRGNSKEEEGTLAFLQAGTKGAEKRKKKISVWGQIFHHTARDIRNP